MARVAGDALGLHNAYIYGLICIREEQAGLLAGAGVFNPCLLFVYNSPLLARCTVVMEPVPDCVVSHDTVKLGVYAVVYVVLMHSGAARTQLELRCLSVGEIGPGPSHREASERVIGRHHQGPQD